MALKNILSPFLIFSFLFSIAQDKTRSYLTDAKLAPREHNVDFTHLRLEVSFDPAIGLVRGKVTERFLPLRPEIDSLVLDGVNIKVKEILLNGKAVKFKNDSSVITVYTGTPLTWGSSDSLVISYEAHPHKGLYFIGWNDKNNVSRKQIWSQGQGTDNRCWIPMYDEMNDKVVSEVLVAFDKTYKVLSNGTFKGSKDNKDGTLTWHYSMSHPHAPYLIMIGIGNYEVLETKSKSGLPMHLYYYPEWKERAQLTYRYSEQMVDFYEKEIGVPFGWESYSQIPVQDYMFGAMENTSATVFGDFFFVDARSNLDRNYVGVNAHELAHQWFGDLVTANSDAHHWLQESFATYYDMLFEQCIYGEDNFNWSRRNAQNSALEESKKNNYPVAHSDGGTVRHYPKGAFVLSMLKYVCGREGYNKAIKAYLEKYKYGNVDSQDLLRSFEETLGYSLDWFWEEWVYKGGEPDYAVEFQELNSGCQFVVKQTQELKPTSGLPVEGNQQVTATNDPFVSEHGSTYRPGGLYSMPFWFEVHYTDGSVEKKMQVIERASELVTLANANHKKVDFVLFDPGNHVLKAVTFAKSFEMLQAQALKADQMLDRYDALVGMRALAPDVKRETLLQVYNKETFQATKAEVISQLASDADPLSVALLKRAIADKDVLVRKAVLNSFNSPDKELISALEVLVRDSSYEVCASALEKLCKLNPSGTLNYLDAAKGVEGTVGRNVICKWLEIAYATKGDKEYADKLIAYSGSSYEFRTRANAMGALKRLDYFDTGLVDNCVDAMLTNNSRLSGPAGDCLNYFFAQDRYKATIGEYLKSKKWNRWQAQKLNAYLTSK